MTMKDDKGYVRDEDDCGCPLWRVREPGDGREPPTVRMARRKAAQMAGTYDPRKNDDRYFFDI